MRDRRYFRDEEEHFETWESKYIKLTARFRSPREIGNRKPSLSLYFPVLFMCWKIFYELGIKKIYNPINIIVSIYLDHYIAGNLVLNGGPQELGKASY